jgi:hypothetical protein
LLGLFFVPEDGGDVSFETLIDFNGLHGVISQKRKHFKTRLNSPNPSYPLAKKGILRSVRNFQLFNEDSVSWN